MYTDWLGNWSLKDGRVRCHGDFDFVQSVTGDLERTTSEEQYTVQKLILWLAIKKGEVVNDPELGSVLHQFLFKPLTPGNMALLERLLEYDLKKQIPELAVRTVKCLADKTFDRVNITISTSDKNYLLSADKSDLLQMGLTDAFQGRG